MGRQSPGPNALRGPFRSSAATGDGAPPFDDGILGEIRNIGVSYFILVRVDQHGQRPHYLCCKTQNEAPSFVKQLAWLPEFSRSLLLRGIERALQQEIYDAADLMFLWTRATSGVAETVLVGEPDGVLVHPRYNYPAFVLGGDADAAGPAHRVSVLSDMFDVYLTTDGNDALRFSIIEATALALGRALGAEARYAEGLAVVEEGLTIKPYSIHLKAARHTLRLRLDGQPVPPRLRKFIGEDDRYLEQFVCPVPFERFDIGPNGDVLLCCGHWLPTTVGNFLSEPVEQVLNSPTAMRVRQSVTDGSFRYCNHLECARMTQGTLPSRDQFDPAHPVVAQSGGRVSTVAELMFALDQTCNLACPSCRTERIVEKTSDATRKTQAVEDKLVPLLSMVKLLHINPAGELFASKPSRRILELISDERCPNLVLELISNGTLFDEGEWNKFPGIHNKIRSIRISVDAARKDTFEKLRRLAKYDGFIENMRFLSRLRSSGSIGMLTFSFTYQLDNFREMEEFVDFCRTMNADFAIFERLQNLGAYSDAEYRSKAVHYPDHPCYGEFIETICKPIFRLRQVWHDFDYPGVENISSQEARRRFAEAVPPWRR